MFVWFLLPPEFSRLQFTQFVAGGTETLHAVIVGIGGALIPIGLRSLQSRRQRRRLQQLTRLKPRVAVS
ncbi:MAG: hypothetical protein DME42_12890, partial [Verrucomicrobia bacterium]